MHASLLTLAELFHQQGYDTAAFSTVDFMGTLNRGFGAFDTEKRFFPADHVVDKAVAWLAGKRRSDAFLLWLHLFDVHEWYRPQHVAEDTLRRAAELTPSGDELAEYLRRHRGFSSAHFGGETEMLRAVDRYDGQILAADAALERLFDAAAARGLDRDALWIVTADHGEGLGNHDFKGHGARLYNEQIRVPLLFYFADQRYSRRSIDRLVRHVDVLPTLADLVGASLEGQVFPVVGHSLRPLFEGREGDFAPRYAFAQRREADEPPAPGWERGDVFSLQSRDFKYIHHSEGEDEFYDLRRDPLETEDRAGTREIQERMRASAVRLKQVMAEQGAELGREGINPKYVEELKALGYL
jgi:arylsulfatase A-like enzyme